MQVYATDGDDDLGGSDFDQCLAEALSAMVSTGSDVDEVTTDRVSSHQTDMSLAQLSEGKSESQISDLLSNQLDTSFANLCSSATIRQKSEEIKKQLTWNTSVTFACDALISSADGETLPSIRVEKVSFQVTKTFFESTCEALFARSLLPVSSTDTLS